MSVRLVFRVGDKSPTASSPTHIAKHESHLGEHGHTHSLVHDLFGHDPDGITAWQTINNALSPTVPYNRHHHIATRLTAEWLAAGKPTSPSDLRRLVANTGNIGPHSDKIIAALTHLNAYSSHSVPFAPLTGVTPVDIALHRGSMNPSFHDFAPQSDILSQVQSQLSHPSDLTERRARIISHYPHKSSLVRALAQIPNLTVPRTITEGGFSRQVQKSPAGWLKSLSADLENRPQYYAAFKEAVYAAAKQLNWSPEQVQETIWTNLLALLATKGAGLPADKVRSYLDNDAVGKGWKSHEAFIFPKLVSAYRRAEGVPNAVRRMGEREDGATTSYSRPGILRVGNPARHGDSTSPVSSRRGTLTEKFRHHLIQKFIQEGLVDPETGKFRNARGDDDELPMLLAHYDEALDFIPALQRAVSANHRLFLDHLKKVLLKAGIAPQNLLPAVHDLGNAARVSVVALGERMAAHAPTTAAAWAGLLGRQPGMMAFTSHPQGQDSIYNFAHQDANAVRSTLDGVGVANRVLVPAGNVYSVYLYDKGRAKRGQIAKALGQLGVTAEEWWGNGAPVGGNTADMGREQYRGTINKAEMQQMSRGAALLLAKLTKLRAKIQLKREKSPLLLAWATDDEAFRAAIDAAPHDDAPKLIYADYLQEKGDPDEHLWRQMVRGPKGYLLTHRGIGGREDEWDEDDAEADERYFAGVLGKMADHFPSRIAYHAMGQQEAEPRYTTFIHAHPNLPHDYFLHRLKGSDPGKFIHGVHPVTSLPISTPEWHRHTVAGFPAVHLAPEQPPIPRIISTGEGQQHLVGHPTEVVDTVKKLRAPQPRQSGGNALLDAIRRVSRAGTSGVV